MNSRKIALTYSILFASFPLRSRPFSTFNPTRRSSAGKLHGKSKTRCLVMEVNTIDAPPATHKISMNTYEVGDVIDLHHSFCHTPKEVSLSSDQQLLSYDNTLKGFFRSLPCDENDFHLGAFALDSSPEPNCYLAPSIDGGLTRRLIVISPIDKGEPLSVPFSFDLENHDEKIQNAIISASSTHKNIAIVGGNNSMDIVKDLGDGRGRGVFAGRDIAEGELVAEWPYQMVPVEDVPLGMKDYMYQAPTAGKHAIVYGHGMLYNHGSSDDCNLSWRPPTDADVILTGKGYMRYYAIRSICKGEELLVSYGEGYWKSRGIIPQ